MNTYLEVVERIIRESAANLALVDDETGFTVEDTTPICVLNSLTAMATLLNEGVDKIKRLQAQIKTVTEYRIERMRIKYTLLGWTVCNTIAGDYLHSITRQWCAGDEYCYFPTADAAFQALSVRQAQDKGDQK